MFEWFKAIVLRWMKVPHEPEPPLGAPGSVRVFRAGPNHYRLKVLRWALGQVGAVVGIGFSLFFLAATEAGIEQARRAAAAPTPATQGSPVAAPSTSPAAGAGATVEAGGPAPSPRSRSRAERRQSVERAVSTAVARMPPYLLPFIEVLEVGGVLLLIAQMFVTFAIVRLEFEQHWYIVTDRSLRIRTGIIRLQESTMSFANVQQVEIEQGPVQRLLGLADICVRSAGGGDPAAGPQGHGKEPSLHMGVFEGVANAVQIRDLILERLKRFREAGLGDPEDRRSREPASPGPSALAAVTEVLGEARLLRQALSRAGEPAR